LKVVVEDRWKGDMLEGEEEGRGEREGETDENHAYEKFYVHDENTGR
jgi:hypothetical protein